MNNEKSATPTTLIIVILAVALLSLGYFTYNEHQKKEQIEFNNKIQKQIKETSAREIDQHFNDIFFQVSTGTNYRDYSQLLDTKIIAIRADLSKINNTNYINEVNDAIQALIASRSYWNAITTSIINREAWGDFDDSSYYKYNIKSLNRDEATQNVITIVSYAKEKLKKANKIIEQN